MTYLQEAVPWLLDRLTQHSVTGIFFLSTEFLDQYLDVAKAIQAAGHTIGSHGNQHHSWSFRPWWQWRIDYMTSATMLETQLGIKRPGLLYRAPKFSYVPDGQRYADPNGHVGLLKHVWCGQPLAGAEVFYCHPFDWTKPTTRPPTPFAAMWYARWREARITLDRLLCSGAFGSA